MEELVRKKRIRAGHKGSVTRIIAQVSGMFDSSQINLSKLGQHLETLKDKREVLKKLDSEILDATTEERELTDEIEESDVFKERIDLAIIDIERAIAGTNISGAMNVPPATNQVQPMNQTANQDQRTNQAVSTGQAQPVSQNATAQPVTVRDKSPDSQGIDGSPRSVEPTTNPTRERTELSSSSHYASSSQSSSRVPYSGPKVKLPKLSLKTFNGDLTTWTAFWDTFESSIHNNTDLSAIDKFNYLNSLLEGNAATAISGLMLSSANYDEAVVILKKRFGNRQQIITKHMDVLMSLEAVTSNHNLEGLRHLYDLVESHVRSLRSLGIPSSSYGSLLSSIFMTKLPQELRVIVSREITNDEWDLDSIMKTVEKEIDARERASVSVCPAKKQSREYPTAAALFSNNSSPACSYCDQPHSSSSCQTITDLGRRKQILMKSGRCFVCLKKGHISKDCRSSRGCYSCGKRHHTSLCRSYKPSQQDISQSSQHISPGRQGHNTAQVTHPSTQKTNSTESSPVLSMYVSTRTPVLLQTARAQVFQPDKPSNTMDVRIILDSGSQRSYVENRVRETLELPTEQVETIAIKTFASKERIQVCDVIKLAIKTKDGTNLVLPFLAVPTICEPLSGQPIAIAKERFRHLSNLELADHGSVKGSLEINILIGADHYWKFVTGKVTHGTTGPTAIHTVLGWVLSGPVPNVSGHEAALNLISAHALKVEAFTFQCNDCSLDQRIKEFWDLETLGIRKNESSVYDTFMQTINFQAGRYCVRLPWKDSHPTLPDNLDLSQRRLYGLLRRLRQEPRILKEYDAIIKEQLEKGIVEVVDNPWNSTSEKVHYIPHHAVFRNDKQTTKLRIVYDASSKTNGPSLNDCLYAGPAFGQSIFDIVLRFRVHKVALVADIEKAFLMVSIAEEDRDVLRFLWFDNITNELPELQVLRFTRVTFGVSSSPFLLNATIKHHMEKYRTVDDIFVDKFERSIYVDDITFGTDDEDKAFELYTRSKQWLMEGGFNLRKFVTNCSNLQERIDRLECSAVTHKPTCLTSATLEDESYVRRTLGDSQGNLEGFKVLGVRWNPTDDTLVFDIRHICSLAKEMEPTRRNIVGIASRFYDPLGILSPITVRFKLMFQDLCIKELNWDDRLSGEQLVKWKELVNGFHQERPILVPRWYSMGLTETSSYSLHGFSDASQRAFAAVVYLQVVTSSGCVVRLVSSKTRVSPAKEHTIPRLELLAALLLARLLSCVESALMEEIPLKPPICHTDLKVALYWIKGVDKEWKQFIENRVMEIRKLVPVECWMHCPGKENPADLPSRGMSVEELMNSHLWFNGPSWLIDGTTVTHSFEEDSIPEECIAEMKVNDRRKHQAMHVLLVTGNVGTIVKCENFSTLTRLLRVTGYVLKFIDVLKAKRTKPGDTPSVALSARDISVAEAFWIKSSQQSLLEDERFQTWKMQFGMYCDESGLWRCGGRLGNADLAGCETHPILLHSEHHFTALVVNYCYKKVMHGGVKDTLTELRSRFWIIRGRCFVRKLLHQCVVCRKIDGKPYSHVPPPPLPDFRVVQSPPFAFTGLDYAGPLYLKGTGNKVWICLFTCCATRAVHLDLVVDMTATSFISCFRRFTARRGVPRKLISDNSKTFKAASKTIFAMLSHPDVEKFFLGMRIEWSFNLEKAPWWGGFFERLIGSTKRCLKRVIGSARLSYDELLTVIAEVEAILNSRPLSYVSSEDLDEPLTPSHLLTGHRLISLPDPFISNEDPDYVTTSAPNVLSRRMQHLTAILDHFWQRWKREYLTELRESHRFAHKETATNLKPVSIGDIVLIHDEDHPRIFWKMGKIEDLIKGADGVVRGAIVRSGSKLALLKRPIQRLFPLEVSSNPGSTCPSTDHVESEQEVSLEKDPPEPQRVRPQRVASQRARKRIKGWIDQLDVD